MRTVKEMDSQAEYGYVLSILLPETFIYRSMVLGHSWETVQEIFMEIVEDRGEKEAFKKEI